MKCLIMIVLSIFLLWCFNILWKKVQWRENFSIKKNPFPKRMIRDGGEYNLDANTSYYFDMTHDNSYMAAGKPRKEVSLRLEEDPKDGDTILLIDKHDRFGWGNLSYDFRIVTGDNPIRGDDTPLNLFLYRGGYIILIWNKKENVWEVNGQKGDIQNKWNGWYKLEYKGMVGFSGDIAVTTLYPSYMRIDATQNPVLVTIYGGTKLYPINLIIKADVGNLIDDKDIIEFPEYKSLYKYVMKAIDLKLKMLKNGIILDYQYGGGWKKDESIPLDQIPIDLHELN